MGPRALARHAIADRRIGGDLMPTLSSGDAATLRKTNYRVKRYVSVAPRTIVYQAPVDAAIKDGALGTYVGIRLLTGSATGDPADVLSGYTVEVGTTPGGRDVGITRARLDGVTGDVLFIAETGSVELPVEAGHYVTVRRERQVWQRLQRLVDEAVDSTFVNTFTQYKDYGLAYTDENEYHRPLANVEYAPAGWVSSGLTYRTVTLDATGSEAVAYGASITGYSWSLPVGVALVTGYTLTDSVIQVQADAGCHEIALTVTDSNGKTSTRYLLLWAHDASYKPLTNFAVTRDETRDWREMDFEFFDDGTTLTEADIFDGTPLCYWEDVSFGGSAAPAQYRGQFLGWAMNDAVLFRRYRSVLTVTAGGVGAFLARMSGPQDTLVRSDNPSRWSEMAHINDNRLACYLLRYHTTALDVANLYQLDIAHEWGKQNINKGTIWEQVNNIIKGSTGVAGCDSLNGIWIRRHPSYMNTSDRNARAVIIDLTNVDWPDDSALQANYDRTRRVGKVKGGGFFWDGTKSVPLRSLAPGDAQSYALPIEEPPAFALPPIDAQDELNRITGCHYAYLNNELAELPIRLIANLDAIEPAWREWVTITVNGDNIRGQAWSAKRFIPKGVAVTHSNAMGEPARAVTLTLEAETGGAPGETSVISEPGLNNTGDYTPPTLDIPIVDTDLGAGLERIFLIHKSGEVSITSDFQTSGASGGPDYVVDDLSLDGDVLDAVTDPYSPRYIGTGSTVNAWIVTTTRIYHVADIANVSGRVVTSQFVFAEETTYRTIQTERGIQNWVLVSSYYQASGVKATRTTDGSSWNEVIVSNDTFNFDAPLILAGSGSTTLFVEAASMGQSASIVVPSDSGWYQFGFGWNARTYTVAGAWYVISNYSGSGLIKQMGGWDSGMPGGYSELWPNQSQNDRNGSYVGWPNNYAGYSTATVASLLGATARSTNGYAIAAGGKPWAGYNQGWNAAASFDITVRLIGYGTPPPSGGIEGVVTPTVYVSSRAPGVAYVGAVLGTSGALYKTTDYGANWSQVSTPASNFGQSIGMSFHFPWNNNPDELHYFFGNVTTDTRFTYLANPDGLTTMDITPAANFGPVGPKAWSTSATNRLALALMAYDGTNVRGYRSEDGGSSWSQFLSEVALASAYTGVHIAGDPTVMYLWGPVGVGYTSDGGVAIDDRSGDASSSDVVAIGGW